ncbi:sigma 54-interacting transcriptional regulator [Lacinutrix gracilariae]|uniref:Sigma 54-interacting transcriptional regulator n=1 Tax=Lacinutrix gracilariae TaxID=1747198 RepID=A0ABW5K578_9FLAO
MKKKTILIVDDVYENLYFLKIILEQANFLVIEANDGRDGLEKLKNNKVDLIISDILMPVMDGYMLCQACKKDASLMHIPFVFYTSTYTDKLDEDFALKLGATHFLRKPTDPEVIIELIHDIFKKATLVEKTKKELEFTEQEALKLYSKRLISKLEQKNLDLEKEALKRKKAQQILVNENEVLDLIASNTSLYKIFNHILSNYESLHPEYYGSISLMREDGVHLDFVSGPSIPKEYKEFVKSIVIGDEVGSCGTSAFTKKPVVVSDISTSRFWKKYKDVALKYNLKSCWSIPVLSENNEVLGTFAIYSSAINTPSLDDIKELNSAVRLAKMAIVKFNIKAEVKKQEESYKSLVSQASDIIISYSLEGTIYSFNKAAYQSLGYTKKEFSTLKIQDFYVDELIQNTVKHQELLDGKSILFPRKYKRKDGSVLEVEVSAKLQNDGKVLAIARDITEWQNNLKEIRDAKEFSSSLLNSMREGLVVINLESEIIRVNPAFCAMTGFSEKELIGVKRPFPYSPPELREGNDERYKLLLANKNKKEYENTYMRKNGERFPVYVSISSLYDENGEKTANFSTVQDITERKKAELALQLAKEFRDKLIMSMQEGLLITGLNTKIILVNDSLCKITGYSKEELTDHGHPYPFWQKSDHEAVLQSYEDVASEEAKEFHFDIIKKNGEKITASFYTGTIKNDKHEVVALYATVKDVSEELRAKQVLIDRAKKSNEKKDVILKLANLVGEDFSSSLNKITELAAKTLNVGRVSVWKFNEDKKILHCENLFNLRTGSIEKGMEIQYADNPDYFEALNAKKALLVKDVQNNAVTKLFLNPYLKPNNITSLMDVFINSATGYYGIICFEHVGDSLRDWSAEDLEFATSIANVVSLMVESTERKIAENKITIANQKLTVVNKELNQLREQLEQENVYLRNELELVFNYEEMVYGSEAFSNVLTEVEKVAPTNATVLLLGESGTGKELLARAIHNTSLRNNKPLIKVNCSAIPRELIESELFGHKKGSFTGAVNDKVGKFELADKGTLFLDEIGELPLDMQPKILRFLQEGEIEVVGSSSGSKKLDVRVIAATNRNLKNAIEKKEFREDLYFRLNVFPINVPALRDRKEDVPLLVEHFVDKFNKAYGKSIQYITDDAMNKLKAYNWPGNIRELENLIERASILSTTDTLVVPGFESSVQKAKLINNKDLSLDTVQRNHIVQVLEQCNWKISGSNGAADVLKLKPSTLRDRMTKLKIVKP